MLACGRSWLLARGGCCWGRQMGQPQKGEGDAGCWLSPCSGQPPFAGEGGTMGQGISRGSKPCPGTGRDGSAGGGRAPSLGAAGHSGTGTPTPKVLGTVPSREAAAGAGHSGWGRAARAGSLGKPGAQRAGASRLAELVLLLLPVAHQEQRFRGCPGVDARPGCQREAALLLPELPATVLPRCWHHPCPSA